MSIGIKLKAVVNDKRMVEIPLYTLRIGSEVEVIVLADEDDEMDTTEYLLSTEANRNRMLRSLEEAKHAENYIPFNLKDLNKSR